VAERYITGPEEKEIGAATTPVQSLFAQSLALTNRSRLASEVLKLSAVRNTKRNRFLGAQCITLTFYAVLLVGRFAIWRSRPRKDASQRCEICHSPR
jgi:hypothetical protein